MNKRERREWQRLKQRLEKIATEMGHKHVKGGRITVQMMTDIRKFEDEFKALGE